MSGTFTIGALAQAAGVNLETIRFYERSGLLPAPQRSAAGYRHYQAMDVRRLRFIRRGRELGFSLEEIRSLCDEATILRRGKVVARSHDGMPSRVVGTHSDITRLKEAEDAQRAQQLAEAASASSARTFSCRKCFA